MRPIYMEISPADAVANGVCLSQTPVAGVDFTLNGSLVTGGKAVFDVERRVVFNFGVAETGKVITVTGKDANNNDIYEKVTAAAGSSQSTLRSFKSVSSISMDQNAAAALTVGTNGIIDLPWIITNHRYGADKYSVFVNPTGTINLAIEQTFDDPYAPGWKNEGGFNPDRKALVSSITADTLTTITDKPTAFRIKVNSFSTGASAKITVNMGRSAS